MQHRLGRQTQALAGGMKNLRRRLGGTEIARTDGELEKARQTDLIQVGVAIAQGNQRKARRQLLQRRQRIGITFDLIARRVELCERSIDVTSVVAMRRQRRGQGQTALGGEIMRQVRILAGDAIAQHAHGRHRIVLGRAWAMRLEPRIQALLGAQHHRRDRPKRIVQVQADRSNLHARDQ